jgi:hypothetical protein
MKQYYFFGIPFELLLIMTVFGVGLLGIIGLAYFTSRKKGNPPVKNHPGP